MKILAAFDKFKDSMSAAAACGAAAEGIEGASDGRATVLCAPLTDGGEGFCGILSKAAGGEIRRREVRGPRGERVQAPIGFVRAEQLPDSVRGTLELQQGLVALIEMASAAGLEQVPPGERHPAHCSTRGVGELIREAANAGAQRILLGIGGSATSDLGLGALEALGLSFHDASGGTFKPLLPNDWHRVAGIRGTILPGLPPVFVACDVDNPLLGPEGAAAVYGPQKGLGKNEIADYDEATGTLARMLCDSFGKKYGLMEVPGSGAAGGLGFGLMTALGARFVPGFQLVSDWLDLEGKIDGADLVLTGEGKFDASSLSGKGPYAVLRHAATRGRPVCLLAGAIEPEAKATVLEQFPSAQVESISPQSVPLEQALCEGPQNLRLKAAECYRNMDPK